MRGNFTVWSLLLCLLFSANADSQEIDISSKPVFTDLKKALRNKQRVYRLRLSNSDLKEFPEDIFELDQLWELYLDSNAISVIPDSIGKLQNLKVLSLTNNRIETINPSIGELRHLVHLFLNRNQIKLLPKELFYMHDLEKLDLSWNSIADLPPDIMNFKELWALNIGHNRLKAIPEEIGHLYNLRNLGISDNELRSLPERFFELIYLDVLIMDGNQFDELSPKIKDLKKLAILDVGRNQLASLPDEIGKLYLLERLYLKQNKLIAFPSAIHDMVNLSVLVLDSNPLATLPDGMNRLKALEYLYLQGDTFPEMPQVLYDLNNKAVKVVGPMDTQLYETKLELSRARIKKRVENYKEAIPLYETYLKKDTNNLEAMVELASAYLNNGDFDLANGLCEKVLEKEPEREQLEAVNAMYDDARSGTNKWTRLNAKYEERFLKDPTDVTPLFELGHYYYEMRMFDEATQYFLKALQHGPEHAETHFYLSIISLEKDTDKPFIFSAIKYLLLHPEGNKAATLFPFLYTRMHMKTGISEKDGSTIYVDLYVIRDDSGRLIYKREQPQVDLLVAMFSDLTETLGKKGEESTSDTLVKQVLGQLVEQLGDNDQMFRKELVSCCSSDSILSKHKDDPIFNHYLPFYKELIQTDHLVTVSCLINRFRAHDPEKVEKWFRENPNKEEEFLQWQSDYYKD